MAYLRIALHSCGIGNSIYQWTINAPEGSIRERYQIPENEKNIAVIGIGYFPKQAHCIEAQGKDVEELLIKR